MPNFMDIPPELQHLIEKREVEDRRGGERRSKDALPNTTDGESSSTQQRRGKDRRGKARRHEDREEQS
ncbi:MAG: hypothetical protein R3C99_15330 [Pirellulaceae bacterium]